MSSRKPKYSVKPGAKVNLSNFNPASHGKHHSHKDAEKGTRKHLEKMDQLQYLMYAEHKHSLLIVLQGLDSAGKDGVIRHVLTGMNPQGCSVTGFKEPTAAESDHDFLWRVHPHAPKKGAVAIFNRSYYEDVLVARVHKRELQAEWIRRYALINDFERLLLVENNTTILKFFLHISKDEQLARFEKRLEDPEKNWKISEADYREREYWEDYTEAYEDLLQMTSTEHASWFIIPSDHKWFRNLTISEIITDMLESLDMRQPVASVDLEDIRQKYHHAVEKARAIERPEAPKKMSIAK